MERRSVGYGHGEHPNAYLFNEKLKGQLADFAVAVAEGKECNGFTWFEFTVYLVVRNFVGDCDDQLVECVVCCVSKGYRISTGGFLHLIGVVVAGKGAGVGFLFVFYLQVEKVGLFLQLGDRGLSVR